MVESVAVGASVAWRLLASLEGGSVLLATSALLAYAACAKVARKPARRDLRTVLLTDSSSAVGVEIKRSLELRGCTVSTVTSRASNGVDSGAERKPVVDALVVVGARTKGSGVHALAGLVSEDVYENLKFLESVPRRVRAGGRVVWASAAPPPRAAASAAVAAFHAVLKAALDHTAETSHCEAAWVQCSDEDPPQATADRVVAALLSANVPDKTTALR